MRIVFLIVSFIWLSSYCYAKNPAVVPYNTPLNAVFKIQGVNPAKYRVRLESAKCGIIQSASWAETPLMTNVVFEFKKCPGYKDKISVIFQEVTSGRVYKSYPQTLWIFKNLTEYIQSINRSVLK